MNSVHDNWIYAQSVDHERSRIVLHTIDPHAAPPKWTDIIFEGVVVHHFEQQKVGGGPGPSNVLFDIEASDPASVLGQYAELLARTKNHGWPGPGYADIDDLARQLIAGGARCYEIQGAFGLHGFVFAASMEFRRRRSRVKVGE